MLDYTEGRKLTEMGHSGYMATVMEITIHAGETLFVQLFCGLPYPIKKLLNHIV